jgi:hypothetical protein
VGIGAQVVLLRKLLHLLDLGMSHGRNGVETPFWANFFRENHCGP